MPRNEDLYCNRATQSLAQISQAMMALFGRDIFNMFSLYEEELRRDVQDLVRQRCMDIDLRPRLIPGTVLLPALSATNARRMRHVWDYFTFIYMSHKAQNIRRRQLASGSLAIPIILYLRGTDYDFAVSRGRAAVGRGTMEDVQFQWHIVEQLGERFNVVKALSPRDMYWAMANIGSFLASQGNYLSTVAEFARVYNGGVFLHPKNWRERVLDLFPSASLFLVYVSNQSNGLSHELESLVAFGLEAHTILVLDESRFEARESFFASQNSSNKDGQHLYHSVHREVCAVENPAAFERLVSRFPHTVAMQEDRAELLKEIDALIPSASRHDVAAPKELPFEFHIQLEPTQEEHIAALRRRVDDFLDDSFSGLAVENWPVLLLHLEMNIFLNLAHGKILAAALSSARYAAIADFMRDFARQRTPERVATLDPVLRQCGDIGMNIAYDALAMGEWNDYSDRRISAREQVDAAAGAVVDLMRRSVERAGTILVREPKEERPPVDSKFPDLPLP